MPDPATAFPPPLVRPMLQWLVAEGYERVFVGSAFGDGSGLNPRSHRTRRCGIAVAGQVTILPRSAIAVEGNVGAQVLLNGALPGPIQEVPLAELYAFVLAVSNSRPDEHGNFLYYSDCAWVVDSFAKGWSYCTAAGQMGAIMWRRLYAAIDDRYPHTSCIGVQKVKAHISVADCAGDTELLFFRGGNVIVDRAAKEGAARHPQDDAVIAKLNSALIMSKEVAKFLGCAAERRWKIGKQELKAARKRAVEDSSTQDRDCEPPIKRRKTSTRHRACLDPALRWRCAICLKTANTAAALAKVECIDLGEQYTPAQKHDLWQALFRCALCVLQGMRVVL